MTQGLELTLALATLKDTVTVILERTHQLAYVMEERPKQHALVIPIVLVTLMGDVIARVIHLAIV